LSQAALKSDLDALKSTQSSLMSQKQGLELQASEMDATLKEVTI
jgi:hypothetical protein